MKFKSKLSWTINEYGKDLIRVNLKINKDNLYEGLFKISAFYGCPVYLCWISDEQEAFKFDQNEPI